MNEAVGSRNVACGLEGYTEHQPIIQLKTSMEGLPSRLLTQGMLVGRRLDGDPDDPHYADGDVCPGTGGTFSGSQSLHFSWSQWSFASLMLLTPGICEIWSKSHTTK